MDGWMIDGWMDNWAGGWKSGREDEGWINVLIEQYRWMGWWMCELVGGWISRWRGWGWNMIKKSPKPHFGSGVLSQCAIHGSVESAVLGCGFQSFRLRNKQLWANQAATLSPDSNGWMMGQNVRVLMPRRWRQQPYLGWHCHKAIGEQGINGEWDHLHDNE